MIKYKRYSFPRDTLLFIRITLRVIYYLAILDKKPSTSIIENIRSRITTQKEINTTTGTEHLERVYRLVSYLLIKVLNGNKPCLIRSYIVLEEALKLGLNAQLYIGVDKSEQYFKGHSWILIDNQSFLENDEELSKYTIMLRG